MPQNVVIHDAMRFSGIHNSHACIQYHTVAYSVVIHSYSGVSCIHTCFQ